MSAADPRPLIEIQGTRFVERIRVKAARFAFKDPLLGVKTARLALKDVLLAVKAARFAFKGMPMPQERRWLALSDARLPQTDGSPLVRDASVALMSSRAWLSMRQLRRRAQALGPIGCRGTVITKK
jgi:hypothetical protein